MHDLESARTLLKQEKENVITKKAILANESIKKKSLETLKDLKHNKYIELSEREDQKVLDEIVITGRGQRIVKLRTQILLTFLIVIKLVIGLCFYVPDWPGSPFLAMQNAIAAEQAKDIEVSEKKDEKKAKEETIDLKYLISKKLEIEKEEKSDCSKKGGTFIHSG